MDNIFTSDWHIHTEASYDATMPLEELIHCAKKFGIKEFGITEHVNYPFMVKHLQITKNIMLRKLHQHADDPPKMHLGVELSPQSNFQNHYSMEHTWDLYPPLLAGMHPEFVEGFDTHDPDLVRLSQEQARPYVLALTEEDIQNNEIEYVVAAAHSVIDAPIEQQALVRHWHEQQMFCATDSRVDVVGHMWWFPWSPEIHFATIERGSWPMELGWFEDFNIVPQSMHDEFAVALLQYDKCAEMNTTFFTTAWLHDKFKHQYAEYIRSLFEKGVRITVGTDSHDNYENVQELSTKYLGAVGFKAEDFSKPNLRTYQQKHGG